MSNPVDESHRLPSCPESLPLPGPVRVLIVLAALLAAWGATRVSAAAIFWNVLRQYPMHGGPLYPACSGAFWLLGALWAIWSLLTRRRRAWQLAAGVLGGYVVWYWLDRLLWQSPRPNWPFALVLSLVWLFFSLGAAFHPRTRRFFTGR